MPKFLLAVDGSETSVRATRKLLDSLAWHKEPPTIDVISVHLPVPAVGSMSGVVSRDMLERYYHEESAAALAPARKVLDAAGVKYAVHTAVGPIAETIASHASTSGCDLIYMGTRGLSALSGMLLGSTATKVLHLAKVPVVLVH